VVVVVVLLLPPLSPLSPPPLSPPPPPTITLTRSPTPTPHHTSIDDSDHHRSPFRVHEQQAPAWLPGGGGGWRGADSAPLFCDAGGAGGSHTVLVPLPDVFEPAEVARAWFALTEKGHKVKFLTRTGAPARAAAHRVHGVLGGQFLRDEKEVVEQARTMLRDPEFRSPQAWDADAAQRESRRPGTPLKRRYVSVASSNAALQRLVQRAAGILLTGGLAPGAASMLESEALRQRVLLPMWEAKRPFAALSRGVLALARTLNVGSNHSILETRRVVVPHKYNEMLTHAFLRYFGTAGSALSSGKGGGGGGGTDSLNVSAAVGGAGGAADGADDPDDPDDAASAGGVESCAEDMRYTLDQVADVLQFPHLQMVVDTAFTFPWLNLHSGSDMQHARVVRDGNLITGASRKDAQLLVHRFISMLNGAKDASSGVPRHSLRAACDEEVVLCMPLQIGNSDTRLFVVHRSDLGPGRMLSKVQSYVRRVSGVYRDAEAQQTDVDTLYRGAMAELERLGVVEGMKSELGE
jgi:putative intracellular protease/amidase